MNKTTNKLIPALRFPEFVNEGEWEEKSIGEIGEIITGNTPSTTEPINYNGNKLFVSPADINDSRYINQTKTTLSDIGFSKTRKIKANSVLFVCIGSTIGKVAQNKVECATNQQINSVIPSKEYSSDFLYSALEHSASVISELAGIQAVPIINKTQFSLIKLLFPHHQEQQKIASCLSSLDEVIKAHSQKLAALKEHKKGLMQNLFPQEGECVPKWRFKEFDNSLQKVDFSEIGDIKIGLTHKPDYIKSGIPFLSSKNISGGFIDFLNVQYISRKEFDSMPESTKPKLGDILFTRVGSNLGNPIILEENIEFGIFVSLGAFRVNKRVHNYYIKYWMESDLFWKQVNQKVGGGAKDNLNSTWLKEFELYIPSVKEQQKIAALLSTLDKLITAQMEKLEQLKLHKKGLMQGLFVGV